jgi:hypothetical protein
MLLLGLCEGLLELLLVGFLGLDDLLLLLGGRGSGAIGGRRGGDDVSHFGD